RKSDSLIAKGDIRQLPPPIERSAPERAQPRRQRRVMRARLAAGEKHFVKQTIDGIIVEHISSPSSRASNRSCRSVSPYRSRTRSTEGNDDGDSLRVTGRALGDRAQRHFTQKQS